MAVLKQKKSSEKIAQEQKRQEKLRRKLEIQQKKRDFGESWRQGLSERQRKELEEIVGDIDAPHLIDFIDTNKFFDPVSFYKDNKGNNLDFDYKAYMEAEQAYEDSLSNIDKELNGELSDDEKSLEEFLEEQNEKDKKENDKKNKSITVPRFLQIKYKEWTKYFSRFVPLFNKQICSCCGQVLSYDSYFPQYIETNLARIEENGTMRSHVCINCCKRIYEYLFYIKAEKDPVEAMKWFCSYMNVYFDEIIYYKAKESMEKNGMKFHIVQEYMYIIDKYPKYKNKTFMDSNINFGGKDGNSGSNDRSPGSVDIDNNIDNNKNKEQINLLPDGWDKQDEKNRKLVIKMVGYDPFDYETDENRKQLYNDFLGMLEQGMEMDQVKMQAAIQIVTSFLRVRELTKTQRMKELEGANVNELKAISDLKAKELKTITDFSKDNGFSERYATKKSKGENSFTGIMKKMDESKYEDNLANKYDMATSSTIQAAADASMAAIFKQLSLGEAEAWQTCQTQLKRIDELTRENAKVTEELREAKYELAKINLLNKAKEQGTLEEDEEFDEVSGGI